MHGLSSGQIGTGRPQRIVRRGDQYLITVVQKRVQRHLDQFTGPVAGINIFHGHIRNLLDLRILHDGFSGGKDAPGIRISLGIHDIIPHIKDHFLRCRKAKRRRIADVELEDLHARFFHAGGLIHYGASDIVQNIIQL